MPDPQIWVNQRFSSLRSPSGVESGATTGDELLRDPLSGLPPESIAGILETMSSESARTCPNCGRLVEPGFKFCDGCGTRLDGPLPPLGTSAVDSPAKAPPPAVAPRPAAPRPAPLSLRLTRRRASGSLRSSSAGSSARTKRKRYGRERQLFRRRHRLRAGRTNRPIPPDANRRCWNVCAGDRTTPRKQQQQLMYHRALDRRLLNRLRMKRLRKENHLSSNGGAKGKPNKSPMNCRHREPLRPRLSR